MLRKTLLIIFPAIIIVSAISVLFYSFTLRNQNDKTKITNMTINKPIVKWQKTTITITEEKRKMAVDINAPKVITPGNYDLDSEINKVIRRRIESLKDDFISAVNTAAEDNGETNILNVDTEVLLITPRLISLAFTTTEHLAGINDNEPERTFIIFDLVKGELMVEGNEMFRDDIAWSRAVKMMKNYLLADYQGDPSCDLLFAPKHNGFNASCIGVDWSRGGKHLSIMGDISMSMIQEFLAPSVLSDIIQ